jgi:hypothetical protein
MEVYIAGMHEHETGAPAVARLESDLRTFSPAGIERVAWGWRQHEHDTTKIHTAEQAALRRIESANRGPEWESLRTTLHDLMEGSGSLLSWKEEHGREGHTAERAVYAAALALLAGDRLEHAEYETLVRPLAEALPWLLPERPPEPRGR